MAPAHWRISAVPAFAPAGATSAPSTLSSAANPRTGRLLVLNHI